MNSSVHRIIYYAGWSDKHIQIFSTVNPVASAHFNFSTPEPTGVVAAIAPEKSGLLGLVSVIMPIIISGNSCVVLASESMPLCAVSFAEVINTSDVPGGVINILTGSLDELQEHMASHMDVNSIACCCCSSKSIKDIQILATENLKRVVLLDFDDLYSEDHNNPYYINEFTEVKTTWHPIEKIGAAGSGY